MDYQPYNYSIQQPDPSQAIIGGIKNAIGINEALFQRDERQRAQEAQQAAQARAQQQQADMAEVLKNPTLKAVQKMSFKYPELGELWKNQTASLTETEKQAAISSELPIFMALKNKKPEVAMQLVERQLQAAKNSGDEYMVFQMENARDALTASPESVIFGLTGRLSAAMGSKEFADATATFDKNERDQQLQPLQAAKLEAETRKTGSEADKAAVVAKFAESDAVMELEKKGWDIKAIQNDMDVKRQNVAIASMNAQTSRMSANTSAQGNSLKAQENQIKLAELVQKRDDAVREKVAEAESTRASMDNLLNITDKILQVPKSVVGSAAGPISSRIPTLSQSTADFEALVETAGNLITMSNMGAMKGVLSDSDLKVLRGSQQNLSLSQSPETLISNVKELQRITLKSRKALANKYGIPDTIPDTPNAAPSGASGGKSTDEILRELGVN